MEKINEQFALNLKTKRKQLKLTQAQFADMIGYSEKAVSKWERGGALPPTEALIFIADKLTLSLDELVGYKREAEYYLGIDGGGTKTRFTLVNSSGKILKDIVLKSCNPIDIGINNSRQILSQGIKSVCKQIPYGKISVCVGISGGGSDEMKKIFADFLESFHFAKSINGNDLIGLCAQNLKDKDGAVVIAGTGLSAFVCNKGKTFRIGGYGYMFGEGGDGYSIGRDAIRAALKYEDGYGEKTLLYDLIKERCGKQTIFQAIPDVYKKGKREVASYAPLVFEAYDKNDRVATEIIEKNCMCIAELLDACADKLKTHIEKDDKVDVVLFGGILNRADIIIPIIKKYFRHCKKVLLKVSYAPAVYGNIRLAGYQGDIYE